MSKVSASGEITQYSKTPLSSYTSYLFCSSFLEFPGDKTSDLKNEFEVKLRVGTSGDLDKIEIYANGEKKHVTVLCRIDTPIEIEYYKHGGILPYVLRELLTE